MENIFFIAGLVVFGVIITIVIESRLRKLLENNKRDDQSLVMLNQNIQGMQTRLGQVNDSLNTRLDKAAKVIGDLNKELGSVQEIGRNMQDLQHFLKSPKLRGNIGEQVLQDLLSQSFPQAYFDMQYKFTSGEIVDAILKTDNGIICIDSKFPLENFDKLMRAPNDEESDQYRKLFMRDVRKHIKDISRKYILPSEGTVNFALMYVPSEAVYYDLIRDNNETNAMANEHKVLIVSPNSFYYFLRVLMIGMQGKRIEEQAAKVLATMEAIVKDSQKVGDSLGVLNTHVTNSKSALERVNLEYQKLSGKIEQIKLLK